MHIRLFRDSLVLSLTGVPENNIRPGRADSLIYGKPVTRLLTEDDKTYKNGKRCQGCYEKISINESCSVARNKARRVSTYCSQCHDQPHLCAPVSEKSTKMYEELTSYDRNSFLIKIRFHLNSLELFNSAKTCEGH